MSDQNLVQLSVVAFTHQGCKREHNEDTIAVGQWVRNRPMRRQELSFHPITSLPFICLIADGMGGHAAGEVASVYTAYEIIDKSPDFQGEQQIEKHLKEINKSLFDLMVVDPSKTGMGTTIAGLSVTEEQVFIFNVGDSRIYREQNGYLRQISIDDSSQTKIYGDEEAQRQNKTGTLIQALGGASRYIEIAPHIATETLQDGQRYLICSDGLSDMVDLDTMEACLNDNDLESTQRLFEKAIDGGGDDNISILMVRVSIFNGVPQNLGHGIR
jgi:PPM family protein phosphatase